MDAVEEVKSRLNIEDVIGEYVELKRSGRNFKGLSPFSSERTPSFMVSPEKQIWHDFSSGKGGTMFSFVMEMEGLDFKGALELLARKAGVDLEQFGSRGQGNSRHRERLYEVMAVAVKFYQVQFSRNNTALEYVLKKRQFTKETALEWQLGYSPNTGNALCNYLVSKGFTPKEIKEAGLVSQGYTRHHGKSGGGNGMRDMFRGRLMIPLHDAQGRPIGFTARLLEDVKDAPKYINTPQTQLYDKSRHVFGLHLAKDAIRKTGYAVLAEGNLDVIQSHQAGVRQVVATAGTALTEQHLKALSRFTTDIRLSFDADKAGINATERAIPVASRVGVSLSIVTIPSGKDPDELIKQNPDTWRSVIEEKQYALDWLIGRYKGMLETDSGEGKWKFSDILLPVVNQLQDKVEREHYLDELAKLMKVNRDALEYKLKNNYKKPAKKAEAPTKKPVASQLLNKQTAERLKRQNNLLALALMQPSLRRYLEILEPEMLPEEQGRTLLEFLKKNPDFASAEPDQAPQLRAISDYAKILPEVYEELYRDLEDPDLQTEAALQQAELIKQYVRTQKHQNSLVLGTADEDQRRALLEQDIRLNQLLSKIK